MNGAERLCRILYGRKPEIGDTIGGLDAQMLTDAGVDALDVDNRAESIRRTYQPPRRTANTLHLLYGRPQ